MHMCKLKQKKKNCEHPEALWILFIKRKGERLERNNRKIQSFWRVQSEVELTTNTQADSLTDSRRIHCQLQLTAVTWYFTLAVSGKINADTGDNLLCFLSEHTFNPEGCVSLFLFSSQIKVLPFVSREKWLLRIIPSPPLHVSLSLWPPPSSFLPPAWLRGQGLTA